MHINQIDFLENPPGGKSGTSNTTAPPSAVSSESSDKEPPPVEAADFRANTPMMKQYHAIKARYSDCLLFFRLGDFYEMFFDDAVTASKMLGLTLTTRNKNMPDPVPLCGVPYHSYRGYVAKLIRKGFKVAICEQVEDPALAKGIVKREVTQVISSGMVLDDENLEAKSNNYLAAIYSKKEKDGYSGFGFAYLDITTGEFRSCECERYFDLISEIYRVRPRQVLVPTNLSLDGTEERGGGQTGIGERAESSKGRTSHDSEVWEKNFRFDGLASLASIDKIDRLEERGDAAREALSKHFQVQSLDAFGVPQQARFSIVAALMLLSYVREKQCADTNPEKMGHIQKLIPYSLEKTMLLDPVTRVNLEIELPQVGDDRPLPDLVSICDETMTSLGGRKLRLWLNHPLLDKKAIEERLSRVEVFAEQSEILRMIRADLGKIQDIERIVARCAFNSVSPRELVGLRTSLGVVTALRAHFKKLRAECFRSIESRLTEMPDLLQLLQSAVSDDPPAQLKEAGGVIRKGYSQELDSLRYVQENARELLAAIEQREKTRTKIATLKVKYNRVFGYFIEVTKSNLGSVPADYIRKQTVVGGERFITAELKELESKILRAEEDVAKLERALFQEVRSRVFAVRAALLELAGAIAELDVLASFAHVARKNRYVRPSVDSSRDIEIVQGRHPILEQTVGTYGTFVPNDTTCSADRDQILLITGPNMAGKSTIMRQVALIVLMAQCGSFVPAERARIGIVDRLFTRIGAQDNLSRGQSTFMVEMNETSAILNRATDRSLILLDEIGRGTSTYDGISIAWAVIEYVHEKVAARTLFATHYHELVELEASLKRLHNYNVVVKEWGGKVIFLRKLERGACSKSYGIQVASLAGLPRSVIKRAFSIMKVLEKRCSRLGGGRTPRDGQMDLFWRNETAGKDADSSETQELERYRQCVSEISKVDLNQTTPLQALKVLSDLQAKLSPKA